MLEELDSVVWEELYADGDRATRIPHLVRTLLVNDHAKWEAAAEELIESICPQGSCVQAAASVVPFLYELAQSEAVLHREKLLKFLVTIAVGLDSDLLPYWFDPMQYYETLRTKAAEVPTNRKRVQPYGKHVDLQAYDAVYSRAGIMVSLLEDHSEIVRCAAAFSVCWFPGMNGVHEKLGNALQIASELSTAEMVNFILAYGLIGFHHRLDLSFGLLAPYLDYSDFLVRYSASIALAYAHCDVPIVLSTLKEAAENEDASDVYGVTLFNEGNVSDYAQKILRERI